MNYANLKSIKPLIALTSCAYIVGCGSNGHKPIDDAGQNALNYITAKNNYVAQLESAYIKTDSGYTLVAVTGPNWSIGDVIDLNNPLVNVTNKCKVDSTLIPENPIHWANLPSFTSSKKIEFGLSIPKSVASVLNDEGILGGGFKLDKQGYYSLSELESVIIPTDDFESALSSDCRDILSLRGGYIVRGIVSGIETFSSKNELDVNSDITVLELEALKLSYNDKNEFILEDNKKYPKMFFLHMMV